MEAKNMASLGEIPGVSRIVAEPPQRQKKSPTVPPSVSPKPDSKPPLSQPEELVKTKGKLFGKKTRIALAGLAALGAVETTGAVISEQNNDQRISAHTIVQDVVWPLHLGTLLHGEVPATFDNEKPVIGTNNMKIVTKEEAEKNELLTPEINVDNNANTVTVSTFFPLIVPSQDPNARIPFNKTLELTRGQDPKTLPISAENFPSLPKDSAFVAPKGSHYAVVKSEDGVIRLASAFFYDEINDATVMWDFGADVGFSSNMPTMAENYKPSDPSFNFESLPESDGITPIVVTIQDNERVDISISVVKGKYKAGNRDFILAPETTFKTDGQSQKLIALASQNQ